MIYNNYEWMKDKHLPHEKPDFKQKRDRCQLVDAKLLVSAMANYYWRGFENISAKLSDVCCLIVTSQSW